MEISRRTLIHTTAATGAIGALGLSITEASAAPRVQKVLARQLQVPWGLAFLPSGNALVSERVTGDIHVVYRSGGRRKVGTVSGIADVGEGGLLGLAVSPNFRQDRWLYAYYTSDTDNRIVRMRYENQSLGRQQLILSGIPKETNHDGGRLRFGPDGMLYATTGDAQDPQGAQDTSTLGGKILRMTPTGGVPAGNPFGNHVWTYGHRNVAGLDFDARGRAWASEFGQNTRDEMNRIVKGGNYGWPNVEGGDGDGPFRDPFVVWEPTSVCSPGSLAIARGQAWVGALRGEALYAVRLNNPGARTIRRFFHQQFGRIRTVEAAPDGSLWIMTSNRDGRGTPSRNDDRVIRLTF